MKKLVLIFVPMLALLLTACPEGDAFRIEKKFHGLKGAPVSLREYQVHSNNEAGETVVYAFDKSGNTFEVTSYDPTGRVNFICNRQYDKQGLPVVRSSRSPFGDEVIIDSMVQRRSGYERWHRMRAGRGPILIEFTSAKQLRTMKVLYNNGKDVYETYEYLLDDNKNVVEQKVTRADELVSWIRSEYDASGSEVRTLDLKDTSAPVTTYTYDSFDHAGNWTKRTTLKSGTPTVVTVREILYDHPAAAGQDDAEL